jgi:hypothetical protein
MENQPVNYIDFYDAENLLFEKVGPEFRQGIDPSAIYFQTLLGWKSERPGDAHWMRLMKISGGTMEDAVAAICADIRSAADDKARLAVLMRKWQFYLPTAVTILVVLYPEFFTMYDVRTRNQTTTEDWSQRNFTDALWKHYCDFKDKVVALAPLGWELRDADRYVMGKDIYESREKKLARIARGEGKPRQKRKRQNANANETGVDASVLMPENVGSSGDRPGVHA